MLVFVVECVFDRGGDRGGSTFLVAFFVLRLLREDCAVCAGHRDLSGAVLEVDGSAGGEVVLGVGAALSVCCRG